MHSVPSHSASKPHDSDYSRNRARSIRFLILLAAVLAELEKEYHIAQTQGFDKVLEDWKTLSVTLGQEVRVIFGNESYTGKAIDIDKDGCLLVDTGKHVTRVIAGDVSIRPIDAPIPKR